MQHRRRRHRLAQQAATIAAQIDHNAGDRSGRLHHPRGGVWRGIGDGLDDFLGEAGGGVVGEGGDAHHQHAAEAAGGDGFWRQQHAFHRHVPRLAVAAAQGEADAAALWPGQQGCQRLLVGTLDGLLVDGEDVVVGLYAGLGGGAAELHLGDHEGAGADADSDADAGAAVAAGAV